MLRCCLAAATALKHGGSTLKQSHLAWVRPLLATLALLTSCMSYREGNVAVGPPPPPLSETPSPRPGYVWAPGYWVWEGSSHAWVEGHWMPARAGEHWVADQWQEENGRWCFEPGHWALGSATVMR